MTWRNPELTAQVEVLRSWIRDVNGGVAGQQEFADRYLYEPFTELLRRGRILFSYVSSGELFGLGTARLQDQYLRALQVAEAEIIRSHQRIHAGIEIGMHEHDPRSGLVFLGIMTSVPLVIPITVLAVALLQSAFAPSNEGFTVPVGFACLYWSGLFVLPALTLYYCVNAYNEPLFSRDRKLAAVLKAVREG